MSGCACGRFLLRCAYCGRGGGAPGLETLAYRAGLSTDELRDILRAEIDRVDKPNSIQANTLTPGPQAPSVAPVASGATSRSM